MTDPTGLGLHLLITWPPLLLVVGVAISLVVLRAIGSRKKALIQITFLVATLYICWICFGGLVTGTLKSHLVIWIFNLLLSSSLTYFVWLTLFGHLRDRPILQGLWLAGIICVFIVPLILLVQFSGAGVLILPTLIVVNYPFLPLWALVFLGNIVP